MCCNDSVAGDDEGDRIASYGLSDRLCGTTIHHLGDFSITDCFAVRNAQKSLPDALLKQGASWSDCNPTVCLSAHNGILRLLACKIIVQPSDYFIEDGKGCRRFLFPEPQAG